MIRGWCPPGLPAYFFVLLHLDQKQSTPDRLELNDAAPDTPLGTTLLALNNAHASELR
jgi:hypothetical protein